MAAESILDSTSQQALVVEANAITASRTRMWDVTSNVITTSQTNFLNAGTPMNNEAIRFFNGTPGQFANAVPAS